MKKIILIFTIFAFSTGNITAQEWLRIGVKGGVNFSHYNGQGFKFYEENTTQVRTAYHFGFIAEFYVSRRFSIQPEILYSAQGFTANFKSYGSGNKLEFKTNYITIPVMGKFDLYKGLKIELGPQIAYLINSSPDNPILFNYANYGSVLSNVKKIDIGVGLGLSYELEQFLIYARYNAGLTNTYDFHDLVDVKNSVFQLGVGYML